LLEHGGMGHTIAIHSQNEAAVREFGQAVPAFRVCVNTSAVHGSIGYSTNLFPAMTLGCGALGGNITSDNIGPQHLMNIKRIAWASRAVEHRTVPAEQRMAGQASVPEAPAVPELPKAGVAAAAGGSGAPDRAVIARTVEHVMTHLGIPRGAGFSASPPLATAAAAAEPTPAASSPAAEIVSRVFREKAAAAAAGPPAIAAAPAGPSSAQAAAAGAPVPPKTEINISTFVSETDVRSAITRQEKIFIGPKTIVTPSARDLGLAHEVFIETGLHPR